MIKFSLIHFLSIYLSIISIICLSSIYHRYHLSPIIHLSSSLSSIYLSIYLSLIYHLSIISLSPSLSLSIISRTPSTATSRRPHTVPVPSPLPSRWEGFCVKKHALTPFLSVSFPFSLGFCSRSPRPSLPLSLTVRLHFIQFLAVQSPPFSPSGNIPALLLGMGCVCVRTPGGGCGLRHLQNPGRAGCCFPASTKSSLNDRERGRGMWRRGGTAWTPKAHAPL